MTPADALLDHSEAATPSFTRPETARYRVLVADDQSEVIEALRLLLGLHGIAIVAASNPVEALALASRHAFDAALVDLNYEKGRTSGDQGLELLEGLRTAHPFLPVVAMTAWNNEHLAVRAMQRGARDIIEKPWDEARLVAGLRTQAELGAAWRRVAALEAEVRELQLGAPADQAARPLGNLRLMEVEGLLVKRAMDSHHGNVSRAARALGLSRSALYRRLERHKI